VATERADEEVVVDVWTTIADEAAAESLLWRAELRPEDERERTPVFSPLGDGRFALGLETIYEGYLLHYGRPRLFTPPDGDTAVLLGDYLYAHGLVRISALGDVVVVADLAELISLCAQLRAGGDARADGVLWAGTVALLGSGDVRLDEARTSLREQSEASPLDAVARSVAGNEAVDRALAQHERRVH
jgi:hypothetical protein